VRSTALWILAAIAGVLLVAGVTAAASTLSTQAIGLSSEPLTAGEQLTPRTTPTATPKPKQKAKPRKKRARPQATATPAPTAVPTAVPTVDDHGGGSDDHSGKGSGGSDDHGSGGHGADD
jgi:hypothetical protein